MVDGEIVVLDANGRPSFQALHHWSTAGLSIVYYAFDLLSCISTARDSAPAPLDERRDRLRSIIGDSGVLLSDALPGTAGQIATPVRLFLFSSKASWRSAGGRFTTGTAERHDKPARDVGREIRQA